MTATLADLPTSRIPPQGLEARHAAPGGPLGSLDPRKGGAFDEPSLAGGA